MSPNHINPAWSAWRAGDDGVATGLPPDSALQADPEPEKWEQPKPNELLFKAGIR